MLNLSDSRSNAILQAAVYLDQLKEFGHQLLVETPTHRLDICIQMKETCAALELLSNHAFSEKRATIQPLLQAVLQEIQRFSEISKPAAIGNCPLCQGTLSFNQPSHTSVQRPICSNNCTQVLFEKIAELEQPTEVWLI